MNIHRELFFKGEARIALNNLLVSDELGTRDMILAIAMTALQCAPPMSEVENPVTHYESVVKEHLDTYLYDLNEVIVFPINEVHSIIKSLWDARYHVAYNHRKVMAEAKRVGIGGNPELVMLSSMLGKAYYETYITSDKIMGFMMMWDYLFMSIKSSYSTPDSVGGVV